jgi:hypothetical protein
MSRFPNFKKIYYWAGLLFGRRFRAMYYRRTGGRWWWGIHRMIEEDPQP